MVIATIDCSLLNSDLVLQRSVFKEHCSKVKQLFLPGFQNAQFPYECPFIHSIMPSGNLINYFP